jgi:hypothetical protein
VKSAVIVFGLSFGSRVDNDHTANVAVFQSLLRFGGPVQWQDRIDGRLDLTGAQAVGEESR